MGWGDSARHSAGGMKRRRSTSLTGPGDQARWGHTSRRMIISTFRAIAALPEQSIAYLQQFRNLQVKHQPSATAKERGSAKVGAGSANTCGAVPLATLDERELASLPVSRLKAYVAECGLNSNGCAEKSDLVALLLNQVGSSRKRKLHCTVSAGSSSVSSNRDAASRAKRVSLAGNGIAARRKSMRLLSSGSRENMPSAANRRLSLGSAARHSARQREELRRIGRALDDLSVLGITHAQMRALPLVERQRVVLRRFRELSRVVHPDKCTTEVRVAATQCFQRLELAKQNVMSSIAKGSTVSPASRATRAASGWATRYFGS